MAGKPISTAQCESCIALMGIPSGSASVAAGQTNDRATCLGPPVLSNKLLFLNNLSLFDWTIRHPGRRPTNNANAEVRPAGRLLVRWKTPGPMISVFGQCEAVHKIKNC